MVVVLVMILGLERPAEAQISFRDIYVDWSEIVFRPAAHQSWVPVTIVLGNNSDQLREIEVRLSGAAAEAEGERVAWRVTLGPNETQRRILPAYVGNAPLIEVYLRLLEDGKPLNRDRIALHSLASPASRRKMGTTLLRRLSGVDPGLLVGDRPQMPQQEVNALIVAPDNIVGRQVRDAYSRAVAVGSVGLRARDEPRKAETSLVLDLTSLPVALEAYEVIDRVILCGVEPEDLGARQAEVLRDFVRAGRVVWLVPDGRGRGVEWVLPKDRYSVGREVRGDRELWVARDDPGVADPAEPQRVLIYSDGLGEWRRLASTDNSYPFVADLVWDWYCELGSVADDSEASRPGFSEWHRSVDEAVRNPPNPLYVFGLIVAYLIVIGPALFWFARRRRNVLSVLWWQPAIVVVFVGVILAIAYVQFGSSARSYETAVLFQPRHSSWASAQTLRTIYNPTRGEVDLRLEDGSLPFPRDLSSSRSRPEWSLTEAGWLLSKFVIGEWSYAHFVSGDTKDLGGPLRSESVRRQREASDVEVPGLRVENRSRIRVNRFFARIDGRLWRFDRSIDPGGSVEVYTDEDDVARQLLEREPSVPRAVLENLERAQLVAELDAESWSSYCGAVFESGAPEPEVEQRHAFLVVVGS